MLDTMMQISLSLVAFDKMSRVIRDAVQKSDDEFKKLQNEIQRTSERLDKLGKNMMKIGGVLTAGGIGAAYKLGITDALGETVKMEHSLRELGNIGELTNEQLKYMQTRIGQISQYSNQYRNEVIEGLSVLVASGLDPIKSLDYMNVIGKTATAAQAEIVDISKTAFAVTDNLKVNVNELGKTMDILAQAGKEGRFELKDMASAFPSLTAGASMLGMRGVPAVAALGSALQVAMKGAGSASEAANNLENFIQKVTSPLAVKNFQEAFGIDLKKVLIKAANEGKDPILEVIQIMKTASKGDMFKISEVFQDKQVLNFLKPMIQNLEEYKRIKESALSAEGIMDKDYSRMMQTTLEQWKLLKINMKELVFPHLEKPLKTINSLLSKINKNPLLQKGLFKAIIGTIGAGVILTVLGFGITLCGKFVSAYGKVAQYARLIAPSFLQNSIKTLDLLGLNSTSHNLNYGIKIKQSGDKLGLASAFSLKSGFMADIGRIDNNLRKGIINAFKNLPSNIINSVSALKTWTVNCAKAVPSNVVKGLTSFKNSFFAIPSMIRGAIIAFRAFSITLLTSPIGWIALAIAAAAFLIFKYWKPITGFFKGVWQGLKEGLQPLMPLFKRIGTALEPVIKPLRAIIQWFKNLLKPVEDTGGAAEKMGVKFGKALADIIVKIVEVIAKVFEFGKKISEMIANGIMAGIGKIKNAISTVTQTIRDFLPHSPAKTGPLKDLHKIKIMETVASTIKPAPLISAMNKSLAFFTSGSNMAVQKAQSFSRSPIIITYSPTVSISGNQNKDDFIALLKKHKEEIVSIIKKEIERKERLAY